MVNKDIYIYNPYSPSTGRASKKIRKIKNLATS